MLWIESVRSVANQATKMMASATAKHIDETRYGTCNTMWMTSAIIVPKMATMRTANQ